MGIPPASCLLPPASLTLLIINPLSTEGLQALFRTHPPTAERIRRLLELAGQRQTTTILA